jgi:hypothetical protein
VFLKDWSYYEVVLVCFDYHECIFVASFCLSVGTLSSIKVPMYFVCSTLVVAVCL